MLEVRRIRKALKKWRKERHLTISNQLPGLINNLLEELNELKEAKDDYERVDAYCDMAVFALNVIEDNYSVIVEVVKQPKWYLNNMEALEVTITMLSEDLKKYPDLINELLVNFVGYLFSNIYNLGFDWFKAMQETIKEISSRVGEYDESKKKWIKDKSPEAVAKWYKANYKECRNEM